MTISKMNVKTSSRGWPHFPHKPQFSCMSVRPANHVPAPKKCPQLAEEVS